MQGFERRRHERVPLIANLTVEDLRTGQSYPGRSIDISRGGMGFFSSKFLPVGMDIRITMQLSRNGQPCQAQVYARVVRGSVETGGAVMGAVFDSELTPGAQPILCECVDRK